VNPRPFWEIINAARYYKNGAPGTVVPRNGYPSIHLSGPGSHRECVAFVAKQEASYDASLADEIANNPFQLSFSLV
jgi:hypothetical protein